MTCKCDWDVAQCQDLDSIWGLVECIRTWGEILLPAIGTSGCSTSAEREVGKNKIPSVKNNNPFPLLHVGSDVDHHPLHPSAGSPRVSGGNEHSTPPTIARRHEATS